ncbi:Tn3 family transposase [Streptosporangium carneum]|uniref:Tn3 transposase DDE domain-containing protein n=1 Tax=Streptosporangium carneum TaxID=47481 RepID=A0A9W6I8H9_9ACTN|nr:hypothetical protein GCM10017600_74240 [Streptosporangium carneum]
MFTAHTARYLSDPPYQRKITRQLNKGESLHALRRDLHYAQQGAIVRPHLQDQTEQAWCLTLLTDSVICWTTECYSKAIAAQRAQGRDVPECAGWGSAPAPRCSCGRRRPDRSSGGEGSSPGRAHPRAAQFSVTAALTPSPAGPSRRSTSSGSHR